MNEENTTCNEKQNDGKQEREIKVPNTYMPKSDALTEMFTEHKTYDINNLLKRQIKQIGMIG